MARTKKIMNDTMVAKEESSLSFTEWVSEKYREAFIENIPLESLKELPPTYMTWMGYFAYFVWVASLVYFVYSGYTSATTQEYMSLDSSSGSCDTVPYEVSDIFLADEYGYWESHGNFQASHAIYELEQNAMTITNSQYSAMMKDIKVAIDEVASGATSRDLYQNILYWTTWQYRMPNTVSDFYFKADISTVFNKVYHYSSVASSLGSCPVKPSTSYDISSSTFTISFDYEKYMNASCDQILDPVAMGHISYINDSFEIHLDMRSFMIAAAVNNFVISEDVLERILATYEIWYNSDGSISSETAMYFHPRFPNHTPIFCGTFYNTYQPNGIFLCALEFGNRYVVPIFNHVGVADPSSGSSQGRMCDCSTVNDTSYCNNHDGLFGFLVYSGGDGFTEGVDLASKYANYQYEMNILAYNASFDAVVTMKRNEAAYDFCEINGIRCSVVMLRMFGRDRLISDMYLTLQKGACRDTFSTDAWDSLADTAPTKLEEDYYTCTQYWYDALFDSLGIASGNTAMLVPLVMTMLLPIVYLYLQNSGDKPMKKEYEEVEVQAASGALALMILRIRDGKTRDTVANGVLRRLTKELMVSARSEGGYPDSDDDDEEEEEEEEDGGEKEGIRLDVSDQRRASQRTRVFISPATRRKSSNLQQKDKHKEKDNNQVIKNAMHRSSDESGGVGDSHL